MSGGERRTSINALSLRIDRGCYCIMARDAFVSSWNIHFHSRLLMLLGCRSFCLCALQRWGHGWNVYTVTVSQWILHSVLCFAWNCKNFDSTDRIWCVKFSQQSPTASSLHQNQTVHISLALVWFPTKWCWWQRCSQTLCVLSIIRWQIWHHLPFSLSSSSRGASQP